MSSLELLVVAGLETLHASPERMRQTICRLDTRQTRRRDPFETAQTWRHPRCSDSVASGSSSRRGWSSDSTDPDRATKIPTALACKHCRRGAAAAPQRPSAFAPAADWPVKDRRSQYASNHAVFPFQRKCTEQGLKKVRLCLFMLSTQGVQRRRETRARDSLACSNGPSWKAVHEARRRRGRWQPIVQFWWHNFGDTRLTYKTVTKQNFDGTCSPLPPLEREGRKVLRRCIVFFLLRCWYWLPHPSSATPCRLRQSESRNRL